MGLYVLVTPDIQTVSAHISDVSVVTCLITPDEVHTSVIPVLRVSVSSF